MTTLIRMSHVSTQGILQFVFVILLGGCVLLFSACGRNPYLEASLDPAEFEGKHKSWFQENWGKPNGKTPRFFGGESWTYFRIAGGETSPPFFNFAPHECQVVLDFDEKGRLEDYSYSGC